MAKVEVMNLAGGSKLWRFHCPGCKYDHSFDSRWSFNGDFEKPTFAPSLLVNGFDPKIRCHSFVCDGKIQFLSDCFHELAGQTVELPDYEEV